MFPLSIKNMDILSFKVKCSFSSMPLKEQLLT